MTLNEWLSSNGETVEKFAQTIGHKPATVYRYMTGNRLPRAETFRRIFETTGGKVTPNDFFGFG